MATEAPMPAKVAYQLTPEGLQKANTAFAKAKIAAENGADNQMTRSWIGTDGRTYNLSVLLSSERICDIISAVDETGKPIKYTFDQLPYYVAQYELDARMPNETEPYYNISYIMCWPTYYIWNQWFTWEGDTQIPIKDRNYDPVQLTDLANDQSFTNNFQESPFIGTQPIEGTTKFEFWTLMDNSLNGANGLCIFNGRTAQTYCTQTQGSTLSFDGYDSASGEIEVNGRYSVRYVNSVNEDGSLNYGSAQTKRVKYEGTARIEGFSDIVKDLPAFGDIHVFNAGKGGSAIYGDLNPFTGNWGPFTQLYLLAGDSKIIWNIDPTAKEFSREIIGSPEVEVGADENLDDHSNLVQGYMYADAKYADNTDLNPEGIFNIVTPYFYDDGSNICEIAPVKDSFVPYGYGEFAWSMDWGTYAYEHNNYEAIASGTIGWGTTSGFNMSLGNHYRKTFNANSTGNVIYHYDPTDVQKTRVFSTIGELAWSGVEGVVAEGAEASIVAANGVITIVPVADCNVAVYTLDGACVKNVKAEAGEAVEVAAAAKGVYVVKAGETSKKVIL